MTVEKARHAGRDIVAAGIVATAMATAVPVLGIIEPLPPRLKPVPEETQTIAAEQTQIAALKKQMRELKECRCKPVETIIRKDQEQISTLRLNITQQAYAEQKQAEDRQRDTWMFWVGNIIVVGIVLGGWACAELLFGRGKEEKASGADSKSVAASK